jgi:diaminopimelate decarboxylase
MASSYNCRPLSPQVVVDGNSFGIVGDRILPAEMAA